MTLLSDYTSSIALWLDEGRPLSPKWVALELGVSTAAAAKLLYSYKRTHPSSCASYLITGEDSQGSLTVAVVPEGKLEDAKAGMKKVRSVQVYSLQAAWSDELLGHMYSINMHHSGAIIASADTADRYLKNEIGQVQCASLNVAAVGVRHESLVRIASLTRDPSSSSADSAVVAKKVAPAAASAGPIGQSKPASSLAAPKVSAVAQNFFNNSAPASKPKIEAKADIASAIKSAPAKDKVSASSEAAATSKAATAREEVDDDGEWNDGGAYSTDKKNLKRRRNPVIRDEDEEETNTPAEQSTEKSATVDDDLSFLNDDNDGDSKNKGAAKGKFKVHGAMDDFIEDAAIANYKKSVADGTATEGAEASAHTTKRRKLVPKVFTDDKGYLITEMVWEECSDTEPEPAPKKADCATKPTNSSSSSSAAKPAKPAGKAAAKEAPQGAQKSMMSFFGKK